MNQNQTGAGQGAPVQGLQDPSLARIASLPLAERAAHYEELHARLTAELESAIGQDELR